MSPGVSVRVLVVLAALVRLGVTAAEPAPEGGLHDSQAREGSATRVPPAPPDVDLLAIRNIFRYADEPLADGGAARRGERPAVAVAGEAPLPLPRVRLVGIVHRGGRTVAALSIDGEVLLLGEGQSSSTGFTVLAVGEESVRLREPGGEEETLQLP